MKKIIVLFLITLSVNTLRAQVPDTEIFLIEVFEKNNRTSFGKPVNITNFSGYDNQPFFTDDGKKLLYVSMQDTIQTDIFEYDIATKKTTRLGKTVESEYSPAAVPGGDGYSIVRVDLDKGQRLYKFTSGTESAQPLVTGLDSVAYYSWIDDTTMALIILNRGMDLYIYDIPTQQYVIAANQVGRCVLKDPITGNVLFTMKSDEKTIFLTLNVEKFESDLFCEGLEDAEDYVFTPAAEILAGYEGKLYVMNPHGDKKWKQLADFSESIGDFYRIAMSKNGKYMAVVSFKGKRP